MSDDLNPKHIDMINEYILNVNNKNENRYMITVARDGESPARSIFFYINALDASEAYNKYTDWGFAKNYLTITMYEPSGNIVQKILKRIQAGECTFIKQDYIELENILLKVKDSIGKDTYEFLCTEIMRVFAKDSWRFSPERFLDILGINKKLDI